jgi:hypothetical protein
VDVPHFIAQVGVAQVAHYWRPMRGIALQVLHERATFIEVGQRAPTPDIAKSVAGGGDLALGFLFQPGQGQVCQHHLRQLFERYFDFVGMLPGLIARLAIAGAVAVPAALAQHVTRLPRALTNALLGLAILKPVLLQIAQRNPYPPGAIRGDDGLFGNQLAEILADGVFHPLVMPQAILESPATQFPGQFAITTAGLAALYHTTSPAPGGY